MNPAYLVTTSVKGLKRTVVWEGDAPLALGHPFRFIIERTDKGVRVRDLTRMDVITRNVHHDLSFASIEKGTDVQLQHISLRLKPVQELKPIYESDPGATGTLNIFACVGNWITGSTPLAGSYRALQGKKTVFSLEKSASGYRLKALEEGLELQLESDCKKIARGETLDLQLAQLTELSLRQGAISWRFAHVQSTDFTARKKAAENDAESAWFNLSMRYSALALGALIALSWIWPKPKESQELVPAQFAKIVLTAPKPAPKEESAPSSESQASSEKNPALKALPKKVQETAVVQAFRAQALQHAVSGLLKGGMTKLLAQSDFVIGSSVTARKSLDTKSDALKATAPDISEVTRKNVKIASLGGQAGGNNPGYTQGEHAAVNGQGHSFVSMDAGTASVEEGLSKDEVGEVIHKHISEIRYCYESAMLRSPDIEGKLVVSFTIGGGGAVKSSEVKQSTLPDPRLDDCILRRLGTWKFPAPKGGMDVAVTYPFIFKTLGR